MENQEKTWCPLCKAKKIKGFAVCAVHKEAYKKEVVELVFNEKIAPTYEAWLIEKITAAMPDLKKAAQEAEKNHKNSADLFSQLVETELRNKTGAQYLELDIIRELRKKIVDIDGEKLRKAAGEPTAFYEKRVAEARLQEAMRILKELRQKELKSALVATSV
jgi:hypothetical protein